MSSRTSSPAPSCRRPQIHESRCSPVTRRCDDIEADPWTRSWHDHSANGRAPSPSARVLASIAASRIDRAGRRHAANTTAACDATPASRRRWPMMHPTTTTNTASKQRRDRSSTTLGCIEMCSYTMTPKPVWRARCSFSLSVLVLPLAPSMATPEPRSQHAQKAP